MRIAAMCCGCLGHIRRQGHRNSRSRCHKLPQIAIVGRPNVGKSTLFNRLTGTRAALVSDIPGLTRDRREGEADLGGHAVRIVDTAGLEDAAPATIAGRMRQQSEAAIAAADLILFVIDAKDGVTATDEIFARTVRASGRPVVLVANKCEGRSSDEGFYEAFKLGLGEPVAISAEHGLGLGELTRDAMAALGLKQKKHADDEDAKEPKLSARFGSRSSGGRIPASRRSSTRLLGEERMITAPSRG